METTNEEKFEKICQEVEVGVPVRTLFTKYGISPNTFYTMAETNESLKLRYNRAKNINSELIFEDILEIADNTNADVKIIETKGGRQKAVIDGEAVQRSRLKIDARKWILSKMNPKKYGDKIDIDHTTLGEKIEPTKIIFGVNKDSEDSEE